MGTGFIRRLSVISHLTKSSWIRKYDTKERFASYWHQINEAINLQPLSILEVGIGTKFVSSYLEKVGFKITTVDIIKELSPAVNASIIRLPFIEDCFDVCLCCEILEHLPFKHFSISLMELHRVCKSTLILSLPDVSWFLRTRFDAPLLSLPTNVISLPTIISDTHVFDGEHYWEIGKKGYTLARIQKVITSCGFNIIKTYRVFENPYHRFFILDRTK